MAEPRLVKYYEPQLCRLKGQLLAGQGSHTSSAAEECFRRAIETSRARQAKSLELQATTGLARLLARTGRREEARQTLADVYGWFTEGFDTASLRDAKALLDEVSG